MENKLKLLSIDHINMKVKNLNETVTFYNKLFGFELKKDQPERNSKIIGNDALKLCLYEQAEFTLGDAIGHFGFHIENFDDTIAKCNEMNIEMPYGLVEYEDSRSVYINDPNGYEIELSEVKGGGL